MRRKMHPVVRMSLLTAAATHLTLATMLVRYGCSFERLSVEVRNGSMIHSSSSSTNSPSQLPSLPRQGTTLGPP